MTVSMQVDLRGDKELQKELRRVGLKTGRLGDVLGDIGAALEASTQQRFIDKETPEGEPWKEHAPATKEKRGEDADILRDKQHLFDSLSHSVGGGKVAVGVNMIYGRIQQLGGEAGRTTARVEIEARPYLGVSRDDEREMFSLIQDHMGAS